MIVVTGASGQLGHQVIKHLIGKIDSSQIIAAVRTPEKASDLSALGVQVREADYSKPDTLKTAFEGADKILLISSSELGQRVEQHRNVIEAAKNEGVSLIAYTSLLHADTSPLGLAGDHIETEKELKQCGIPYVLLRNGWYTENYLASVMPSIEHGAFIGSAGTGQISSAARDDYAEAAALVMTSEEPQAGKVYELAGDEPYTLSDLAALISQESNKEIPYVNLPENEFKEALVGAGLPEPLAALLSNSDVGAAKGGLFDKKGELSALIGRPTTTLSEMVKALFA
ncbi:NAD(P)-dependent oxidoreductase [Photobacterium proteolyticum]|uniref:NAD(P)-dependent oxidoreductase n=1 Tax=Photobacterium proteolyticum TaxID=1903952 RepID=A0A1Q9GCR2_9GAMM|nr:SDR family oxidoreductase [Photobacterium proteolyticum]OLQ72178.1 NAD(P)-dependent oxidoreductase [Photobacterium proteolyticum]